jgi:hypothetical protein
MPNRQKEVCVVVGVVAVVDLVDGHLYVEVDTSTLADALHDKMQSGDISIAQHDAVITRLESGEFAVEMR